MPEERPVVEDQILAQLSLLDEKLEARFDAMEQRLSRVEGGIAQSSERMARLEGGFAQMNERMNSTDQLLRWVLGIMITSWLTLVGLTVTILSRLL